MPLPICGTCEHLEEPTVRSCRLTNLAVVLMAGHLAGAAEPWPAAVPELWRKSATPAGKAIVARLRHVLGGEWRDLSGKGFPGHEGLSRPREISATPHRGAGLSHHRPRRGVRPAVPAHRRRWKTRSSPRRACRLRQRRRSGFRLLAGETNYESLRPDVWKQAHPEAIRVYRVEERRSRADVQSLKRARRRLAKRR